MFHALRRAAHRLLSLHGTPHGVALGFTLGLGLSLLPIPFVGMLLALALAPVLRASPAATYLGTMIVNPFTGPVIYFSELWLGASLLGITAPRWHEARRLGADEWWALLRELLPAFALGAGLLAVGISVTVYPVLRALVRRYQRRASRALQGAPTPDE